MLFSKANWEYVTSIYVGLAIFLCSALALVIESGYSYGPALLFLASLSLIIYRPKISITKDDWKFVGLLLSYFTVYVLYNVGFSLSSRAYDGISRFLLVIPVYFLLISYPPKPIYFWSGLIIGAIGAGVFAIYQKFYLPVPLDRAGGFINPIQFGDISFLMASLLLCGFVWARYTHQTLFIHFVFLLASLTGFVASFLSLSRGGWLAFPVVLFIVLKALKVQTQKILVSFAVFTLISTIAIVSLPDSNFFRQRLVETKSDVSSLLKISSSRESFSINARLRMWQIGINAFCARPFTGWGSLDAIKLQYPSEWADLEAIDNFNHLHNEFIDTMAKRGLLGLITLMLLYFLPLSVFMKLMRSEDKILVSFAACGVILIVCVIIFGLTQTFMAHISGITIIPFFLAIIKAYTRMIEAGNKLSRKLMRTPSL